MPRNHIVVSNPTQINTILDANNITDTNLWRTEIRHNITETRNHTYNDLGIVPTDQIATLSNGADDIYILPGSTEACKRLIKKDTTITITDTYTYDLRYFTP